MLLKVLYTRRVMGHLMPRMQERRLARDNDALQQKVAFLEQQLSERRPEDTKRAARAGRPKGSRNRKTRGNKVDTVPLEAQVEAPIAVQEGEASQFDVHQGLQNTVKEVCRTPPQSMRSPAAGKKRGRPKGSKNKDPATRTAKVRRATQEGIVIVLRGVSEFRRHQWIAFLAC